MNIVITSRSQILDASKELAREQGWSAVSIRSVASACGVSVGSIYNYFDSKADLLSATVESVWFEIFHGLGEGSTPGDIVTCVSWIYERMEYGYRRYPDFFTLYSLGFMRGDKVDGQRRMWQTWQHIVDGLAEVIRHDEQVRPDAFTAEFTPEGCAEALFSLMLTSLVRQDYSPQIAQELARRALY